MLDKRRYRACTRFVITLTDKQRFLSFVPANERSGAGLRLLAHVKQFSYHGLYTYKNYGQLSNQLNKVTHTYL